MDLSIALAIFEYVVLLLSLSLHDAVQSLVAFRMGDPTANMVGRQTMNPLRHYDLLGTIVFPLFYLIRSPLIIGWTKDVPMTSRNFKTYRDEMMVYLSGPVIHLVAAFGCMLVLLILKHAVPSVAEALPTAAALSFRNTSVATEGLPQIFPIVLFLYFGILVNLLLFAYNLLPLPWLDGGKVLRHFLPYNARQQYDRLGFYLMFVFFFLGFQMILTIASPILNFFNGLLFAL
ncbi:Zn-dependent protease (includes SpoIVFB) [Granulicella rosea]|uniref:Zn-dependent protease (Includes SpoIVFB) n=1 Tax=Granulicella rosea TaxID=474952 RepID=A0A239LJ09_9BACT|nr:site-2 protease family protein [Granulicella rosea]SNT29659.1 Zn-dependent protease (includes SpoIVFB) [Granulicella rosea]